MNRKTVDIFRHAQSTSNAGERTEFAATIPLTPLGHKQAQALSLTFNSGAVPQLFITSPYLRTGQTAAPALARFPQVPHEVWPIHEFTHLDEQQYRGTNREERAAEVEAYWKRNNPLEKHGGTAESFAELIDRVDAFTDQLNHLPHSYTVAFSHGLFMRALFLRLTRPELPLAQLMQVCEESLHSLHLPNTACLRLIHSRTTRQLIPGFAPAAG